MSSSTISLLLVFAICIFSQVECGPRQATMKFQAPYPVAILQRDGTYCVIIRLKIDPPLEPADTKFIEFGTKRVGSQCPFICKEECPLKSSTCKDHFNMDLRGGMMFFMANITRDNSAEWADSEWDIGVLNYVINQSVHTKFTLKRNLLEKADKRSERFPFINYQCG